MAKKASVKRLYVKDPYNLLSAYPYGFGCGHGQAARTEAHWRCDGAHEGNPAEPLHDVRWQDAQKKVVMSDQLVEIFEQFDDVVAEMTSDPSGLVPLPADLVARVTEGDDDPRFATFQIESGWSKSKRLWGPELFEAIATEINTSAQSGETVVGYQGHIKPENDAYEFPPIQLQWLGAKLLPAVGDKAKLAVKAYVLPGTRARD